NRPIFSERFAKFLQSVLVIPGTFKKVSSNPPLYYIMPEMQIPFDPVKRGTRFENKCDLCGSYERIVGATPAFVNVERLPVPGLYRTDLAFGSGRAKFPLRIVDLQTKDKLQKQKFSGMAFHNVYSSASLPQRVIFSYTRN